MLCNLRGDNSRNKIARKSNEIKREHCFSLYSSLCNFFKCCRKGAGIYISYLHDAALYRDVQLNQAKDAYWDAKVCVRHDILRSV